MPHTYISNIRSMRTSGLLAVVIACRMSMSLMLWLGFCSFFSNGDVRSSRSTLPLASPSSLHLLGGNTYHPSCAFSEADDGDATASVGSYLSPGQRRLCQLYPDHMGSVRRGARTAVDECLHQMHWRRWNCSSAANNPSMFGTPVNAAANRETGFVHALTSAGVMYAVSRACRDGELSSCGCSSRHDQQQQQPTHAGPILHSSRVSPRPSRRRAARPSRVNRRQATTEPDGDWQWGGCGDDAEYGYRFTVAFVDARHKEKNFPRRSIGLGRMLSALHNNEVGRLVVHNSATVACKCHGVSGSCTLRTCWHQLPTFRHVSDRLLTKYDAAVEASFNRHGTSLLQLRRLVPTSPVADTSVSSPASMAGVIDSPDDDRQQSTLMQTSSSDSNNNKRKKKKKKRKRGDTESSQRPSKDDLIFVERSPDYCGLTTDGAVDDDGGDKAAAPEDVGTRGRRCRRTPNGGRPPPVDSCDVLCCGRGYNAYRETIVERCRCRFVWCCHVTCSTCEREEDVHVCK